MDGPVELAAAKLWRQHWSPLDSRCFDEMIKEATGEQIASDKHCSVCSRIFGHLIGMGMGYRYSCPCNIFGVMIVTEKVSELIQRGENEENR